MIVSDDDIHTALAYLANDPHPLALARKYVLDAENQAKHIYCDKFLLAGGSVAAKEAFATIAPEYVNAKAEENSAIMELESHRAKVRAAEFIIECWRTEQSNIRAAERVRGSAPSTSRIGKTDDAHVPERVRARVDLKILEKRLLEKMIPEPNSGCWLWIASCTRAGYGHMWNGLRFVYAHRLSYLIYVGGYSKWHGHLVGHRCDVPHCINPDHLFAGTRLENIHDCIWRDWHSRSSDLRTAISPSRSRIVACSRSISLAASWQRLSSD